MEQAKLKGMLDQLGAPAEQLKHTIVELQMINDQLHKANKALTMTLKEIMGDFHERLGTIEKKVFGEVRGDYSKYLVNQEEDEDVHLPEVQEGDSPSTADAEADGEEVSRGQSDENPAAGDPEGDPSVH
jgi:hypothetical protein